MPAARPTTVDGYIAAAPAQARPHLRRVRELLAEAAPQAEQVIKWNTPFFIEPRFLFGFSAYKAHLSFAPTAGAMKHFARELEKHSATKNTVQMPYAEPVPEDLVRRMAAFCVREVKARKTDSFW